jgi:hypothetical protein
MSESRLATRSDENRRNDLFRFRSSDVAVRAWVARHLRSPHHGAAILAMTALAIVLFQDCVLRGHALFYRDIDLLWYPAMAAFREAIDQGSLPLWNPYISYGQPLLAMANLQIAYPTTWLALVLPLDVAYTVLVVVHAAFTGVGAYALCRRLGISWWGAATAGCLWMASGPLLSVAPMGMYVGSTWLPWAFWAADKALESGRRLYVLAWGGAIAATVVAGAPDETFMAALSATMAFRHVEWRRPLPWRRLLVAAAVPAGAALFAVALSAIQWLPAVDAARRSQREEVRTTVLGYWSNHPYVMAQSLLPVVLEELPLTPSLRNAFYEGREPLLLSLYLGLPSVGLVAAGALLHRGSSAKWTWIILGTAAAVHSMGKWTPLDDVIRLVIPLLEHLRYPSKFTILAALCWAVLAGMGVDAWAAPRRGGRGVWLAVTVAPLAAGALVAAMLSRPDSGVWSYLCVPPDVFGKPYGASSAFRAAWAGLASTSLCAALAAVAGVRRSFHHGTMPGLARLVALIAAFDLVTHTKELNPTVPRGMLSYRTPALDVVPGQRPNRTLIFRYGGLSSVDRLPWGFPFDASAPMTFLLGRVYPAVVSPLVESVQGDLSGIGTRWSAALTEALLGSEAQRGNWVGLLRVAGVEFVVAAHTQGLDGRLVRLSDVPGPEGNRIYTYRVPDPQPRAYAVGHAVAADTAAAIGTIVNDPTFDPRRTVILADGSPMSAEGFVGATRIRKLTPDRLELDVDLSHDGYVVVAESYDPWWTAEVDGNPAPVTRANAAFRAIPVPAGKHRVTSSYRPAPVFWGFGLTVLALVCGGALLIEASLSGARKTVDGQKNAR